MTINWLPVYVISFWSEWSVCATVGHCRQNKVATSVGSIFLSFCQAQLEWAISVETWPTGIVSKACFLKLVILVKLNLNFSLNGRWPQSFSNGRRPKSFSNGRRPDIFLKEVNINYWNGRWPHFFYIWKTTFVFKRWKTKFTFHK